MQLPTVEIAEILGSRCAAPPLKTALGYSIDSRRIQPGDLFFALRGPCHDGHDFVSQAFAKGAVAAVVKETYRPVQSGDSSPLIPVPDTLLALQELGRAVRRKWAGRVVGITGSTGKTTTKEMLAAVLARRFRVLKNAGNLNNHYGVPLTLLGIEPCHEIAVVEMAMSGPGEIALLASLAEPQVGVVTNVAPAHLEFFDSVDSIARAKRELIEHLQSPASAILNHDDERVRRFARDFHGRVVTFGLTEGADYRGLNVKTVRAKDAWETGFEVQAPGWSGKFSIALPGRHNVENALAAAATASLFEIPPEDLRAALASFAPLGQRTEILKLPGAVTAINDAYNSNPRAMQRMLETLASWPDAGKRIVLAGEMLELGPSSPEWHRCIGRECAQSRIEWLLAVQGDARFFVEGAREAGFPADRARFFADAEEAGRFCRSVMQPGSVILVKGSRGVHLEKAIEILRSE